jgi:hypothetical protein
VLTADVLKKQLRDAPVERRKADNFLVRNERDQRRRRI